MTGRNLTFTWSLLVAALLALNCSALDSPRSSLRRLDPQEAPPTIFERARAADESDADEGLRLKTFHTVREKTRHLVVADESYEDEVAAAIVGTMLYDEEHRVYISKLFNENRRLQVLDTILPEIIEIIVFAVAGALVSSVVGVIGGGPILEEVLNIIVLAVAGGVVSAIVGAILGGGGGEPELLANAFNRNLQKNATGKNTEGAKPGAPKDSDSEAGQVEGETIGIIVSAIVGAVVNAILRALTQIIIDTILGILGLNPTVFGSAGDATNTTFTQADLESLIASSNETAITGSAKAPEQSPAQEKLIASIISNILPLVLNVISSSDLDFSSFQGLLGSLNTTDLPLPNGNRGLISVKSIADSALDNVPPLPSPEKVIARVSSSPLLGGSGSSDSSSNATQPAVVPSIPESVLPVLLLAGSLAVPGVINALPLPAAFDGTGIAELVQNLTAVAFETPAGRRAAEQDENAEVDSGRVGELLNTLASSLDTAGSEARIFTGGPIIISVLLFRLLLLILGLLIPILLTAVGLSGIDCDNESLVASIIECFEDDKESRSGALVSSDSASLSTVLEKMSARLENERIFTGGPIIISVLLFRILLFLAAVIIPIALGALGLGEVDVDSGLFDAICECLEDDRDSEVDTGTGAGGTGVRKLAPPADASDESPLERGSVATLITNIVQGMNFTAVTENLNATTLPGQLLSLLRQFDILPGGMGN